MYCTLAQLADANLAREFAQLTTPERYAVVSDELFEAALRGEDLSRFDPADVAVAGEAQARVVAALVSADGVIEGYLALRKPHPYALPLNPVPGIVSVWARQIARYMLNKDRVGTREESDPVVRDYRDAIRFLEQTRDGKFSLGANDPLPPPSAGAPEFCAPPRVYTQETLRDYGQ
jgi:phage gp36-like protein